MSRFNNMNINLESVNAEEYSGISLPVFISTESGESISEATAAVAVASPTEKLLKAMSDNAANNDQLDASNRAKILKDLAAGGFSIDDNGGESADQLDAKHGKSIVKDGDIKDSEITK